MNIIEFKNSERVSPFRKIENSLYEILQYFMVKILLANTDK